VDHSIVGAMGYLRDTGEGFPGAFFDCSTSETNDAPDAFKEIWADRAVKCGD
jgi:hypothetical protein